MPEIVGRLRPPRLASAPATPANGEVYFDTAANTLLFYNGAAWIPVSGTGASGDAREAFRIYRNAAQTMSTPAGTVILFDTKTFDVSTRATVTSGASQGRYVPQIAGYYSLHAQLFINEAIPSSTGIFYLSLRKNGTAFENGVLLGAGPAVAAGGNAGAFVTDVVQANGTTDFFDVIAVWAGPATISPYVTAPASNSNHFAGFLIGRS